MDFRGAKSKAQRVAMNRERLMALLRAVVSKMRSTEDRQEFVAKIKTKLNTLVRMLKAYVKGEYRDIPWKTVVLVTAGLIYFVNPFDLVPDIIPITGLMDDAAIILWIFTTIGKDVEAFDKWESARTNVNPE